jgi:hypothetical protein
MQRLPVALTTFVLGCGSSGQVNGSTTRPTDASVDGADGQPEGAPSGEAAPDEGAGSALDASEPDAPSDAVPSDDAGPSMDGGSPDLDGTMDGASWAHVRPFCGAPADSSAFLCSGVGMLVLSNPAVRNAEAGALVAGESGTIHVVVTNPTTQFVSYPCIGFATDDPRVTFGTPNPAFQFYGIGAGMSKTLQNSVQFAATIPSGTVVHLAAWVDSLHAACTNGMELRWDLTVP